MYKIGGFLSITFLTGKDRTGKRVVFIYLGGFLLAILIAVLDILIEAASFWVVWLGIVWLTFIINGIYGIIYKRAMAENWLMTGKWALVVGYRDIVIGLTGLISTLYSFFQK